MKSVGAMAAGLGANLLAIPVDVVLHAATVFPPQGQDMTDGLYGLALAYRAAFALLGGRAVARLAPGAPMTHAWLLGGLGVLLGTVGAIAQWNLGHHWYPLALIGISLPLTIAGARLSTRS
jgi:hypothetical protein